jgi:DNA-binding Xre family transcriptional regulator
MREKKYIADTIFLCYSSIRRCAMSYPPTNTNGSLFRARLQAAKRLKGWNITVLAERSGLSRVQISRLLHGHRPNPAMSTLVRLCDALEVSADWLLGRVED